jgi:hypothetical protein
MLEAPKQLPDMVFDDPLSLSEKRSAVGKTYPLESPYTIDLVSDLILRVTKGDVIYQDKPDSLVLLYWRGQTVWFVRRNVWFVVLPCAWFAKVRKHPHSQTLHLA